MMIDDNWWWLIGFYEVTAEMVTGDDVVVALGIVKMAVTL